MLKIKDGHDYITKSFRIPVELIERLEDIAVKHKLSLNKLVIQCLEYAEKNMEKDEE